MKEAEEKIGKCIWKYGDFMYESGFISIKDTSRWKKIYNFKMFCGAICLTLMEMAKYGREEYEEISDCLKEFLAECNDPECEYIIDNCPDRKADFPVDPFFLRLCWIVFVARRKEERLVGQFIEVCRFMQREGIGEGVAYVAEVQKMKDSLGEAWIDRLMDLYKRYGGLNCGSYRVWARCVNVKNFFDNVVTSNDPKDFNVPDEWDND